MNKMYRIKPRRYEKQQRGPPINSICLELNYCMPQESKGTPMLRRLCLQLHRSFLEGPFQRQKAASKVLNEAFYAILFFEINSCAGPTPSGPSTIAIQ
jgi:hypothetical protein